MPAQQARSPLGEVHPAEVDLGDAMPVALGPAPADLALDQHDQLGIEAQHAIEALSAIRVGDLFVDLLRLEVGRQEDAHQPAALHRLAARGPFLGGIDDMRGLQVDRAVGQLALRALPDLAQQRLARERHEPQHDHRSPRQLVLVAAPEVAIGLEHVQVRVRSDALHDLSTLRSSPRRSLSMVANRQRIV